MLYEGERGPIYSRGISSNRRIEVGEGKPDRMILLLRLWSLRMLERFVSLFGGVAVVVVLRKRKFCLVRPEWEDGSSNYRSAKNGAKRGF
jgi:hypothetical protein